MRPTGTPDAPLSRSVLVPSSPSFSATRILDLTFTVLFPPTMEGEHLVELRVFTPDGQLYRSPEQRCAPAAPFTLNP